MSALEVASFGSSLVVAFAYLCRLDMLHVFQHRTDVIVFYAAGLGAVLSSASHAWAGTLDQQDVCVIVGLGAWIVTSYRSWRDGVPAYFNR